MYLSFAEYLKKNHLDLHFGLKSEHGITLTNNGLEIHNMNFRCYFLHFFGGTVSSTLVSTTRFLLLVEIKRKPAGREAVLQLAKYVDSVRSMVNREVRGVLVAPSMAKGVQRLLVTLGLDFKALDPKKCASLLRKPETKRLVEFFEENQ